MQEKYSTLDICKILDIPRERFREWQVRGFIEPSIQKAEGQGTKALFSRFDLYYIALFKHLIEKCRLPRENAAIFLRKFKEKTIDRHPATFRIFIFIQLDGEIKGVKSLGHLLYPIDSIHALEQIMYQVKEEIGLRPQWDTMTIVNFEKILKEVDSAIE
ncbi:MAG: hypothetical protein JRJ77_12135 [Deltaproteobacteria bacterium]|nr:hypothetical protein [Deltaproteobacteria bacterium]